MTGCCAAGMRRPSTRFLVRIRGEVVQTSNVLALASQWTSQCTTLSRQVWGAPKEFSVWFASGIRTNHKNLIWCRACVRFAFLAVPLDKFFLEFLEFSRSFSNQNSQISDNFQDGQLPCGVWRTHRWLRSVGKDGKLRHNRRWVFSVRMSEIVGATRLCVQATAVRRAAHPSWWW